MKIEFLESGNVKLTLKDREVEVDLKSTLERITALTGTKLPPIDVKKISEILCKL